LNWTSDAEYFPILGKIMEVYFCYRKKVYISQIWLYLSQFWVTLNTWPYTHAILWKQSQLWVIKSC